MKFSPLLMAMTIAAGAAPAAVQAQPGSGRVTVDFGPTLRAKAEDYGPRELDRLRQDLGDAVSHSLGRNPNAPVSVRLVIEDAQPNRPTFDQLGRTPGLSLRSIAVGGARVSGEARMPDGSIRPIRYQWYETDISQEIAANTWSDADRAFDWLADSLGRGRIPDDFRGPGPGGSGHFGYPYRGD